MKVDQAALSTNARIAAVSQPRMIDMSMPAHDNQVGSHVNISTEIKSIGASVINAEKVNKIKADIANGSFRVNASIVADAFISSAKGMMATADNLMAIGKDMAKVQLLPR